MEQVRIIAVVFWTIPYFGNKHWCPYGVLKVSDGKTSKICRTKGDVLGDSTGYQYITFNRHRYEVIDRGSLHSPRLSLAFRR